jgi:hypothetical protein
MREIWDIEKCVYDPFINLCHARPSIEHLRHVSPQQVPKNHCTPNLRGAGDDEQQGVLAKARYAAIPVAEPTHLMLPEQRRRRRVDRPTSSPGSSAGDRQSCFVAGRPGLRPRLPTLPPFFRALDRTVLMNWGVTWRPDLPRASAISFGVADGLAALYSRIARDLFCPGFEFFATLFAPENWFSTSYRE